MAVSLIDSKILEATIRMHQPVAVAVGGDIVVEDVVEELMGQSRASGLP